MLFVVKVLVSGFRTPFTLHQVPETLFLNGGIKEFVYYKKNKKKTNIIFSSFLCNFHDNFVERGLLTMVIDT